MKIPLYKAHVGKGEMTAVSRVLSSGKLSRGQEVESFEREFAKYTNKKYAIAVNSGTSGLHILVRVMGWKSGDEIITTPFSYVASGNAILFEKATPIFVDIDPITLNIDLKKIEEKITSKTKGILLVHILGLPLDYKNLQKIKDKYKLLIIEDVCETLGRSTKDFRVSMVGEASVYGFHENKQITSGGEGGMIVTDNLNIAKKCWSMRDQGRSLEKNWIKNVILGFNFRMTEMQAAFGREQLKILDRILVRRDEIATKYSELLKDVASIKTPHQMTSKKRSWFVYFVIFKNKKMRDVVHKALKDAGVSSSTNYFPPIYNFPMYKDFIGNCNNAEDVSKTLLVLPIFYEMTDNNIKQVVTVIKSSIL